MLADVLARWHGLRHNGWSPAADSIGSEPTQPVLSTGTDEHGLKIQKAAEALGVQPKELCDGVSLRFKDLADVAGVHYTDFIRTTEERHRLAVNDIWDRLQRNGHIYKGSHEGWYSVSDEAFYPENQIHDVTDSASGETYKASIETGQRVEWTSEENYKFRMSAFRDQLVEWLESNPQAILPASRHEQVLQEVKTQLEDLSISRPATRLSWGLPVPGDSSQSIYVWIDALVNYLTVTGYPWKSDSTEPCAWPADAHVVGKDIIRFHAIYWPCILLAAGLPLPRSIVTHGHWTKNKAKISKSTGNVVDPFAEIEKFGPDVVRYYLCRMGGNLEKDSDYSLALMKESHDKFLGGQLGNLVGRICSPKISHRIWSMASRKASNLKVKYTTATISRPTDKASRNEEMETAIEALGPTFAGHMQRAELSRALDAVFDLLATANQHISTVRPWSREVATDPQATETIYYILEALRVVELCLRSILPGKMRTMREILQLDDTHRPWKEQIVLQDSVTFAKRDSKVEILFPRLPEPEDSPAAIKP